MQAELMPTEGTWWYEVRGAMVLVFLVSGGPDGPSVQANCPKGGWIDERGRVRDWAKTVPVTDSIEAARDEAVRQWADVLGVPHEEALASLRHQSEPAKAARLHEQQARRAARERLRDQRIYPRCRHCGEVA